MYELLAKTLGGSHSTFKRSENILILTDVNASDLINGFPVSDNLTGEF